MEQDRKKIILLGDRAMRSVGGEKALAERYDLVTAPSTQALLETLGSACPDLILIDAAGEGEEVCDAVRMLKADDAAAPLPLLILTAAGDLDAEEKLLSLGASDCLPKPFSSALLARRIGTQLLIGSQSKAIERCEWEVDAMVAKRSQAVLELQNAALSLLSEAVAYRGDAGTRYENRTSQYLGVLIEELGRLHYNDDEIADWDVGLFLLASRLHDIGKLAMPDELLLKPAPLSAAERDEMKKHAACGADMIDRMGKGLSDRTFVRHAVTLAATHHEKWDGTGYPRGLKGLEIPLQGRLMAIVDVYEALVSERPYKCAFPHEEAVKIIEEGRGNHFDPSLIDIFLPIAWKFKEITEGA